MRVIDVRKQVPLIHLTNFISTVTGPKLAKLSCEINSRKRPLDQNLENSTLLVHIFYVLLKNLTRKKYVLVSGKNQIISIVTARTGKQLHP